MSDETNNVIEEEVESKTQKAKRLVKKYQTPLLMTATGAIAFTVGVKVGAIEVNKLELGLNRLDEEVKAESLAHLTALEFIDYKKLGKQFAEFALEMNAPQ